MTETVKQKFKVGDRARFVGDGDAYCKHGDVVTINYANADGRIGFDALPGREAGLDGGFNQQGYRWWHENLILLEDAPEPAQDQTNKADGGKSNPLLLEQDLAKALLLVNRVLDYGAEKYERAGWKKVDAERYDAAARRHKRARDLGETIDAESGLPHLAHEICNNLFELQMAIEASDVFGTASLEELAQYNPPPQDHKK